MLLLALTPFYPQNFNVELVATWEDGDTDTFGTDIAVTPDGWVYVLRARYFDGVGRSFAVLDGRDLEGRGLVWVKTVETEGYYVCAMTVWKDYLYLLQYHYNPKILVYDISDRANPRFLRRVVPPGKREGV